ncbi:MAG: hypothetical protein K8S00_03525 [Bacteroidales bacterium]|nr:hypothetical protein [Bacteroidales bacterium]
MIIFLKIRIDHSIRNSITLFFLIYLLFNGSTLIFCQENNNNTVNNDTKDTVQIQIKKHSPNKAALYSAILPGLGQAYNKKYWKIPVIYAGVGTLLYFINLNNKEYKKFRDAYIYVSSGDSVETDNDYVNKYSEEALLEGRNYYRTNLELTYILSGVLYILNIIDATVDAHLFEYDISDNLSMKLEPGFNHDMIFNRPMATLKLRFKF